MNRKAVSGIMLTLLFVSVLTVAFSVVPMRFTISAGTQSSLPVHNIDTGLDYSAIQEAINAPETLDGHTILVDAGIYYENVIIDKSVSLVGENLTNTIVDGGKTGSVVYVEANNINLSGFTIRNSGTSDHDSGVSVYHSTGNDISHNIMTNNRNGIEIYYSDKNNLTNNTLNANTDYAILLYDSNNNTLTGNNVSNSYDGIIIYSSANNILRNNRAFQNRYNFGVRGFALSHFIHDIDTSNKVDGKLIRYLINKKDMVMDSSWDVGCLCLVNSTNITVKDLVLSVKNWNGVQFAYTRNSRIENVTISRTSYAIDFSHSTNNSIIGNNLLNGNNNGIRLEPASGNTIINNSISGSYNGIVAYSSSNNTIINNSISGVIVHSGVTFSSSSNNIIASNHINNNRYGIWLRDSSSDNRIYHNNFIDNTDQTRDSSENNIWDNGYDSGGNYWSDYSDIDLYSGPSQNETGGDGIWDHPYIIDENNQDNYPLVKPWGSLPVLNINTGLDYETVQQAINANETLDGHTIFVYSGTYYENIVVNKSVWLVGQTQSSTILDGSEVETVVNVTANNVRISGFTVKNSSLSSPVGFGVYLYNSSKTVLQEIYLTDNWAGIGLKGGGNCTITKNIIVDNGDYGISIYESNGNKIINNLIANNGGDNIWLGWSCYNNFSSNTITNASGNNIEFQDQSNFNNIVNNNIIGGEGGIAIDAAECFIVGNNITNNGIGIEIDGADSKIYHNNFIDNVQQVYMEFPFPSNTWDEGYPLGGNYWSDYNGTDLFSGPYQNETGSDGKGDTPYVIGDNNQDRYPLMHPWSSLPIHNLNTGLGYRSIQEAISANETFDGHAIFVQAGIYYEHVAVNKAVSLIGETKDIAIIDGSGTGTVFEVTANNVKISGLFMQNGGAGVILRECQNCAVYGNRLENHDWAGMALVNSNACVVSRNTAYNTEEGISLGECNDCVLTENDVGKNEWGILLDNCFNCTLRNNTISDNEYNFGVWGDELYHYFNDIDATNTINGKPICYLVNKHNLKVNPSTFSSMGYLAVVNSTNITVQNLTITHNLDGVLFFHTTDSTIENVIANDNDMGIYLRHSSNCSIIGNTAKRNDNGIYLEYSPNCMIKGNSAKDNEGIGISSSPNCTVCGNNVERNGVGIIPDSDCTLEKNTVKNNICGIWLGYSNDNVICHNNFIDNTNQADPHASYNNAWDDGYPSGGNYWSDYNGTDLFSGPYQDETGSDGIGDTLYVIDENNQDNYPLMGPWTIEGANVTVTPSTSVTVTFVNVTSGGITCLNVSQAGPDPPSGFKLPTETPFYYDIKTTANYTGTIKISIAYNDTGLTEDQEKNLQILQWNETLQQWTNITTHVDTQNNIIHGETTHLSIFTIMGPPDIAVTNVVPSKTVVGQGYSITINVTVQNQGYFTETFDVSVFYDDTAITLPDGKNHTTTTLTSLNSTTLTIPWNTTGTPKGNYTITAKATPLPGETDTTDNTFVYGIVKVTTPGDITGDFKVDILDFPILMLAYGSRPGDWNWLPNADINCDQVVNHLDRFILWKNIQLKPGDHEIITFWLRYKIYIQ